MPKYLDFKSSGTIHNNITGYDFTVDPSLTPAQSIRKRCLHCVGGESLDEVKNCTATPDVCHLWPYRMGRGCDRSRDPNPPSRVKAIRRECLFCMGNSSKAVSECESTHCHLWAWRLGKRPADRHQGGHLASATAFSHAG